MFQDYEYKVTILNYNISTLQLYQGKRIKEQNYIISI